MGRARRWIVVLAVLTLLCSLPKVVALRPVAARSVSAEQVRQAVLASAAVGFAGYAESIGTLGLPVTDQFNSLADLLGGRTQLRVWYAGSDQWRVDQLSAVGERDTYRDPGETIAWDYESNRASITDNPPDGLVRLPTSADLLPSALGRRLLSQAVPSELRTIGAARIAGRVADGVEIHPAEAGSTINRVQVYADRRTGVPLRVALFAGSAGSATLDTSFLDFRPGSPPATDTTFVIPPGASADVVPQRSLTDFIRRFGDGIPPSSLGGISRNELLGDLAGTDRIGVYGRGVTEFAAAPLPGRIAGPLADQLRAVPAVTQGVAGLALSLGPVSLLLTPPTAGRPAWLLTGTVVPSVLASAATDLASSDGGR